MNGPPVECTGIRRASVIPANARIQAVSVRRWPGSRWRGNDLGSRVRGNDDGIRPAALAPASALDRAWGWL